MLKFLIQLLDLIYKKRCYFCGSSKENTLMCSKCYENTNLLEPKILKKLDSVPVYCAMVYEKNIQRLIRGLKYHNMRELAFFQAKLMYEYWQKLCISNEKYIIVPVPLFKDREKKRKYNQMMLVAEEFSKLTGYEINAEIIKRTKDTKAQYKLTKKEREKNLLNAFECNKEIIQKYNNEKILLIDDILTTGSTMHEMIKTMQKNGINNLTVFVTSCTEYNIR